MASRAAKTPPGSRFEWNIAAIRIGAPVAAASVSRSSIEVTAPLVSMNRPRPDARIAAVSAVISRASARRDGIGTPPAPLCGSFVDVAKPTAPDAIASCTSAAMVATSSSVAARREAAAPSTKVRSDE